MSRSIEDRTEDARAKLVFVLGVMRGNARRGKGQSLAPTTVLLRTHLSLTELTITYSDLLLCAGVGEYLGEVPDDEPPPEQPTKP